MACSSRRVCQKLSHVICAYLCYVCQNSNLVRPFSIEQKNFHALPDRYREPFTSLATGEGGMSLAEACDMCLL